jgi:predicted PurR-regulated permease PerM
MTETTRSPRTLRGDIVFAFAIAFVCLLAYLLRNVLLLLYVSALFAVVLQPLVGFIARIRIGSWRPFSKVAIFLLLLVAVGGLIAFGFVAFPPVVHDLQQFGKEMPARLPGMLDKIKHIPFASRVNTDDLTERLEGGVTSSITYVLLSVRNWASALFDIAMGFILTVYFTLEGDAAYKWALSFIRPQQRLRLDAALRRAEGRMGKWLLGQGSLMFILGAASTVTYVALDIRYAYALGFLTGLLNIIPVVGAAVCIGLALLVAAVDSWGRVLGVAIFYLIYINIENSFLTPRIMKSSVDLPGLAILVALLVGSALAGVLGAMISVPTAVLVAVLLDEYLVVKDEDEQTVAATALPSA